MKYNAELLRSTVILIASVICYLIPRADSSAGGARRRGISAYVGTAVSCVFFLSGVLSSVVAEYMPTAVADVLPLGFLVIVFVSALSFAAHHVSVWLGFERYSLIIYLSAVILGLLLAGDGVEGVAETARRGAVYCGYFIPGVLLFSRIRTRLDESESCDAFAGLPVIIFSGAFLSIALSGILKVWENILK